MALFRLTHVSFRSTQYNEIPPRVEYSLSEKGASAHKILRSICCWAVRYCPLPEESLPPCKKVGGCPL